MIRIHIHFGINDILVFEISRLVMNYSQSHGICKNLIQFSSFYILECNHGLQKYFRTPRHFNYVCVIRIVKAKFLSTNVNLLRYCSESQPEVYV